MVASVASMIDQFNMANIKLLQGLGYKVHVACNFEEGNTTNEKRINRFKKELTAKGVDFFQVPIPRKISAVGSIIKAYFQVKRLVEEGDYKIVHCHSPIGSIIARLACKKARKKGTKVIYTAHGFHFFKGASAINWLLFYNLEKFFARLTDVLITINIEDYKAASKFKAKSIEYVPGVGIDTDNLAEIKETKEEIKESLSIPKESFVLLSVGQLSKRKNHQAIIKALAEINKNDIFYVICGLGELEQELKKLAEDLKVSENVIFTGYRTDVKRLLYGSDCFVFPSTQEGLPVSLMEAMAVGLACIASNIRGNTDLLSKQNSEFLVEVFDVKGYAKAIEKLYEDKLLLAESGSKNAQEVKKFDKKVVNEQMKKIYMECGK